MTLVLAACGDVSGPSPEVVARGNSRRLALEDPALPPGTPDSVTPLRFLAWAPRLESYETTFTITQGVASSDTLYFQATTWSPRLPYLILTVPATAQFVDKNGRLTRAGQKVVLTVRADSATVWLDFGPHGSIFSSEPAVLKVSWIYTDLLGHRASDQRLWYRLDDGSWSLLTTKIDLQFYWLVTQLRHFSNYRVAF